MSCAQSVPNSGALRSIPDNSGQFISRDSRLRSPPFPASTSSPSRGTSSSRWRGAPGPARACPPCAVELAEAEVAVSDEGRMPSSRRRPRFRDSAPHGYWRRPRRDGSRCRSRCSAWAENARCFEEAPRVPRAATQRAHLFGNACAGRGVSDAGGATCLPSA
jgi:hypothetical protein